MTERQPLSAEQRLKILKRDHYKCVKCGKGGEDAQLEIDHIVPVAKGGNNHVGNLQVMCRTCNQNKGVKLERSYKPNNGFYIGMGIHILDENGDIHNQGGIVRENGVNVAIQRYSFFDGSPTDIVVFQTSYITDTSKCKLYANTFDMKRAYLKYLYKRKECDTYDLEWGLEQIENEEFGVEK